ncbi:MAG: hypothetical protein K9J12_11180 [Melioribacteraceae bacterium]|nr:hypothetical protein [Melioribacteraceae bacterium]MCF8264464.1 hypothetical protein [Melioribacteraceae bacterium]
MNINTNYNNQNIRLNHNINSSPYSGFRSPFTPLFLLSFIFLLVSCDTTEPRNNGVLTLTPLDASCTEVWLKVEANANLVGTELTLYRDKEEYRSFTLTGTDTVLFSDGLMPSTNYSFFAQINGIPSNTVNITTMDTTSHDFNWQTFTFGDGSGGSSYLNDVAIVDENNIWAVGMIYENGEKYNAVHWDGSEWKLEKILYYIDQDNPSYGRTTYPCNSAFTFDDGTFAISSNVQTAIFNSVGSYNLIKMGFQWEERFTINTMWGLSSSDFYVVGNGGNIAHYKNGSWNKIKNPASIEVNRNYSLLEITGTQTGEVYIAGGNTSRLTGILIIVEEEVAKIIKEGQPVDGTKLFEPFFMGTASTVWLSPNHTLYFGGHFLYTKKLKKWNLVKTLEGNFYSGNGNAQHWGYITQLRGTAENDIVFVGERNTVRHFNGLSWKQIGMPYIGSSGYTWLAVAMDKQNVIVVGENNYQASILFLTR